MSKTSLPGLDEQHGNAVGHAVNDVQLFDVQVVHLVATHATTVLQQQQQQQQQQQNVSITRWRFDS